MQSAKVYASPGSPMILGKLAYRSPSIDAAWFATMRSSLLPLFTCKMPVLRHRFRPSRMLGRRLCISWSSCLTLACAILARVLWHRSCLRWSGEKHLWRVLLLSFSSEPELSASLISQVKSVVIQ